MLIPTIILAILLALALTPIQIHAEYDENGPLVFAGLGLIRIRLIPAKKKRAEKSAGKKSGHIKPAADGRSKKQKKGGDFALLRQLLPVLLEALGSFRRKLVITHLDLCAWFGGEDPYKTALNYGRAWAAIGCLIPVLESTFTIKHRNIRADLSDNTASIAIQTALTIRIWLYQLLGMGLRYGLRVVRLYFRHKHEKTLAARAAQEGKETNGQ